VELTIREQLNELAEEKYRIFSSALTPGKDNILGVRLPLLRKLATQILGGDWRLYLEEAKNDTMEEVMLQGLVIGGCKADIEEILQLATNYIPKIDCWSVCDCFCGGLKKITEKHRDRMWEFLQPYFESKQEYEIRFGVVMLLHYILPEYASLAFAHFNHIRHEGYYVKMAVAWVLSMYYVHLPEITLEYLKMNDLEDVTYNKTLQKITESLRVNQETKVMIRGMKRK
jgi:3-methyladenine DNA glycosylase AlkD